MKNTVNSLTLNFPNELKTKLHAKATLDHSNMTRNFIYWSYLYVQGKLQAPPPGWEYDNFSHHIAGNKELTK